MKVKKFTKLVLCICLSITCFTCSACKKTIDLSQYLSQLITQVYRSVDSKYNVKATYGFNESPSVSDGKIATKKYFYSSEVFTAPSFDFLNDWIYSLSALSTGFTFDKVMTAINSTLEVFFGLPAQNLWNLVEAIKEWVQTILDS